MQNAQQTFSAEKERYGRAGRVKKTLKTILIGLFDMRAGLQFFLSPTQRLNDKNLYIGNMRLERLFASNAN